MIGLSQVILLFISSSSSSSSFIFFFRVFTWLGIARVRSLLDFLSEYYVLLYMNQYAHNVINLIIRRPWAFTLFVVVCMCVCEVFCFYILAVYLDTNKYDFYFSKDSSYLFCAHKIKIKIRSSSCKL